jgi:sodium/proline symporter
MVVLTAFYLFIGGFMATSIADFIQGCIMIVGVVFMLIYILLAKEVGGFSGAYENLKAIPDIGNQLTSAIGPPGFISILSLVILTSLGSWGLPQMVHKFYTIKNEKAISTAKWVSTGFALLITFGAYFSGSISRLVLGNVKPESYDMIIPMVINKTLPVAVAAIILVLVLSASMSTLASVVLASSSAVAVDLVKTVKPELKDKQVMLILRILCVLFVIASYFLANSGSSILNLAAISWGAVSGCLLAPYLLGLYWKRGTKKGAYVGMITALTIEIVGVIVLEGGFTDPNIPVVGALAIVMPLLTMVITSLMTKPDTKQHTEFIYSVKK